MMWRKWLHLPKLIEKWINREEREPLISGLPRMITNEPRRLQVSGALRWLLSLDLLSGIISTGIQSSYGKGVKRRFRCPLCEVSEGIKPRRENLVAYPYTGTFYCFKCRHYGQLTWLASKYELDNLAGVLSYEDPLVEAPPNGVLPASFSRLFDWKSTNDRRWTALDYLRLRGLDDETIDQSCAGLVDEACENYEDSKFTGRVVFPILEEGNKIAGFVGRSLKANVPIPYLISKGTHKATVIYNGALLKKEQDVVYITEGIFDALRTGLNIAVATLGKDLSENQLDRIIAAIPKKVVFLMDGDAWRLGQSYAQVLETLTQKKDKFYWAKCPAGKDPADLGWNLIKELPILKPFEERTNKQEAHNA